MPVGRVGDVASAEDWSTVARRAGALLEAACGTCKFLLLCSGVNLTEPYRPRAEDRPPGIPCPWRCEVAMRWITPRDPLPTWRRWSAENPPSAGVVEPDELRWHHVPGAHLAISSRTGGWAFLDPDEAAVLKDGRRFEEAGRWTPVIEAAWRRGLVRIGGSSVFSAEGNAAAIQSTRDYYTLVLLLNRGCNLVCTYCYLGHARRRHTARWPAMWPARPCWERWNSRGHVLGRLRRDRGRRRGVPRTATLGARPRPTAGRPARLHPDQRTTPG